MRIYIRYLLNSWMTCILIVLFWGIPEHSKAIQELDRNRISEIHAMTFTHLQDRFYKAEVGEEIRLELSNAKLEEALAEIARQSGLKLSYRGDIMVDKRVSLQQERIGVSDALRFVLDGTDLDYKFSRNGYLLIAREDEMFEYLAYQETVTGSVFDGQNGEALPGVNIIVQGTTTGTSTDAEGQFELRVSSLDDTLMISYVGYQTQEVPIDGRTVMEITLQREAVTGEEVVVIGYGTQRHRDLTGSVSSISAGEIDAVSFHSVDQALQGRLAGMQVTTNSSKPGGGISIRIRGIGSITSGSEPLFVIDGVPIYNGETTPGTDQNSVGPNPLATINPQDIHSIDVLKDASATAIYGSRGANGVIIITTKQGIEGQMSVDFSSSVGFQKVAKTYDLLNAEQFVQLANESVLEGGGTPHYNSPETYGKGTDWQDLVFRSAIQQNHQIALRKGTEDTRFSLSGNFLDQDGVIKNSGFQRNSLRFNLDQDFTNRLRVGTNLTLSRGNYTLTDSEGFSRREGITTAALGYIPVFGPYNENGEYTNISQAAGYSVILSENPVALLNEYSDDTTLNRVLGNLFAEYDLRDNLNLRINFGADIEDLNRERYETRRLTLPSHDGNAQTWSRSRINLLNDYILKYQETFAGIHNFDLTGGFSWQNNMVKDRYLQNANFVNDITKNHDIGAGSQSGGPNVSSGMSEWTLLSIMARANYIFDNKYLFTLTGRYDGSSKFGENNNWGLFPSGAFAWRISEEPFMQGLGMLTDLKLRVSYGLTGNQEIGSYSSLSRLRSVNYAFEGREFVGYIPQSVANPDLKWEKSRQMDFGLDLGLWNDRVQFTADYYRKHTNDLILPVTLPFESGFGSAVMNTGSIRNSGVEFSLSTNAQLGDFLSWGTNMNFSANRNEVTDLGESDRLFGNPVLEGFTNGSLVEVGHPIGVFYGYEADGIIVDEAEAEELGYGDEGTYRFIDQDGDGEITEDDRTVIGSPHPDFIFGWTNTFQYRGFEISAFLQGVYGNEIFNFNLYNLDAGNDAGNNSTVRRYEERWTPENRENATFPKAGAFAGLNAVDHIYIEDGSYLRLKSLTLSYNFSLDHLGVHNVRVYAQGHNLLTFSNYIGFNPDVNSQGIGSINAGYDKGSYPLSKIYSLGFDLSF